jgi:hypothetical protein
MPVIPWFSVLRGGYVDLLTKQPVTTTFKAAEAGPLQPAAQGVFQAQNGLFNPAPRPTSRTIFPITLPSLAYWEKCFKETDPLRLAGLGGPAHAWHGRGARRGCAERSAALGVGFRRSLVTGRPSCLTLIAPTSGCCTQRAHHQVQLPGHLHHMLPAGPDGLPAQGGAGV